MGWEDEVDCKADYPERLRISGDRPYYDWLSPLLNADRSFPPTSPDELRRRADYGEGEITRMEPIVIPEAGMGCARVSRLSGLSVWMDAIFVPNWNILKGVQRWSKFRKRR